MQYVFYILNEHNNMNSRIITPDLRQNNKDGVRKKSKSNSSRMQFVQFVGFLETE
jgi:hypothetical protein